MPTKKRYRPRYSDAERSPAPEALTAGRGSGWKVGSHHAGVTSIDDRTILVTHEGECAKCGADHGRVTRAHELTHAQFSPGTADLVKCDHDPATIDIFDHLAEEVRVAEIMARLDVGQDRALCRGFTTSALMPAKAIDETSVSALRDGMLATITGAAATWSSKDWRPWSVAFTRLYGPKSAHPIRATFDEVVSILKRSTSDLLSARSIPRDRNPLGCFGPSNRHYEESGWGWTRDVAAELRAMVAGTLETVGNPGADDGDDGPASKRVQRIVQDGACTWGEVTMNLPALTNRAAPPPRSMRQFRDEGITPDAMFRFAIDQRIFAPKRKRAGGTFLIDVSGSMGWDMDLLDELIVYAPAGTIATYSGSYQRGVLTVVASEGMRVGDGENMRPGGGNNVIDGPALVWLSKQDGPRVWISDGMATGAGSTSTRTAYREARQLAIAAGACRVLTMDGAKFATTVGRRFTPSDVPSASHELTVFDQRGGAR